MLQTLIVGFGRAGRHLHWPCILKARKLSSNRHLFDTTIGAVDPKFDHPGSLHNDSIHTFRNFASLKGFDPASTVVHICTAPANHLSVLRQVAELGYTKIIVEKPLAMSMCEVNEIVRLQEKWNLDLLIVAVWIHSTLTRWLKEAINSHEFGPLCQLAFEQHKSRVLQTLQSPGHASAFDVELPHQVALALYLGGHKVQVLDAAVSDMQAGTMVIPYMGTAQMTLHHDSGLDSFLSSDLTAQNRKRSITLSFNEHTIKGCFPASGNISYSRLAVYDHNLHLLKSKVFEDDPLTTCFQEYYRYYNGEQHKPVSDLPFNAIVVSVLTRAKVLSGIPLPEDTGFD
ncbi:MAG: Gfo/Idh/MocA family oxidoreductase [Ardenticatenaceae bacterium]|nr:Gfo/Idh/MocA family oxidoreductase [Ardenticatenaceae bacterium]